MSHGLGCSPRMVKTFSQPPTQFRPLLSTRSWHASVPSPLSCLKISIRSTYVFIFDCTCTDQGQLDVIACLDNIDASSANNFAIWLACPEGQALLKAASGSTLAVTDGATVPAATGGTLALTGPAARAVVPVGRSQLHMFQSE
jgi:hypothetical protein